MFSLEFLVHVCANVQRLCGELLCGDRIMYVEKLLRLPLCKWATSMPRSPVGWTLLKATCARHNRTRGVVVMYMRKVCITKSQRSRVKVKDAVSHCQTIEFLLWDAVSLISCYSSLFVGWCAFHFCVGGQEGVCFDLGGWWSGERRRCVVGGVGLGHGARVMAGSRLIRVLHNGQKHHKIPQDPTRSHKIF